MASDNDVGERLRELILCSASGATAWTGSRARGAEAHHVGGQELEYDTLGQAATSGGLRASRGRQPRAEERRAPSPAPCHDPARSLDIRPDERP